MYKPVIIPTFLRWAGGKRRILPLIEKFFPEKIDRYFEPFLGGGSVFFYVKQKYNPSRCLISDTNLDLVNTYIHVRDEPERLLKYLAKYRIKNNEDFYYKTRQRFNDKKIKGVERSAVFIYLNKTCFNGLYRVNRQNKFNVPYGQLKNPKIADKIAIFEASNLLRDNVEIRHQDYSSVINQAKKNDFIYLDPCYDPIKRTSFTSYTPDKFSEKDREKLHNFIETLRKKGSRVVLSNNDVKAVRSLYLAPNYRIKEIQAPRYIGSKGLYRSSVSELVISTNV